MAITLLGIAASFSARLLYQAALDLERAELGLRAALLLGEVHDNPPDWSPPGAVAIGRGALITEGTEDSWSVRFEPPTEPLGSVPFVGRSGFRYERTWSLEESR